MQSFSVKGGVFRALAADPLGVVAQAAKLGPIVRLPAPFAPPILLVSDPDIVEEFLVDKAKHFGKTTRAYVVLRRVLGQGLLTADGDLWRNQRRKAQPAFHRERIAELAQRMADISAHELAIWPETPFDAQHALMRLTLRIVADTLLSSDLSGQTEAVGAAVTEIVEQVLWRSTRLVTWPSFVPTPANRRFNRARRNLDRIVHGVIAARRKDGAGADLLGLLMEAVDPETGEGMSDTQLKDEAMTMFLAGHETTANLLAWTLALLARDPARQQRVRDEVTLVLGGRPVTIQDLPHMPFAQAVLKEAARLYPPIWMVGRGALDDVVLGGERVAKGSLVFVSLWVVHRDERIFSAADSFVPERWLDPTFKPAKGAYLPFLTGPRKCIGDGFALLEANIILAMLLQQRALHTESLPAPDPVLTLRPRGGLPLRCEHLPRPVHGNGR